ncbi:hypothetical protein CAPTEDRAFT_210408 [Capitella teleta]|uniref:Uncharacterized protein n=1 Tax=Capitella teleta TaxID=283909 RepID=N1PB87_CAPTE|nr:hypothetical protein CAPTEDRAFT_210408 [Capitella teleta]|eukprot:ELU18926.1 hypothetical protein CAPTEDRAFT_210408 [Capitella teleta]
MELTMDVMNNKMKVQPPITPDDTDRVHRVGRKDQAKPRSVIIKFTSYRARHNAMKHRKNLRQSLPSTFLTGDPTLIALTETWLRPSNSDLYQLPDYNSFHATQSNVNNLWKTLKDLIGASKNKYIFGMVFSAGTSVISDFFNKYSVNVGPSLASKIPNVDTNPEDYFPGSFPNSFCLTQVTVDEITTATNTMKTSAADGEDNPKPKILKAVRDALSNPLTYTINLIFEEEKKKKNSA